MATRFRSNADYTRSISKSIFVTNFPDDTTAKDLWRICHTYGTVVDVFIPNRKSKAGKRFAFVRFIKVDNVDRLVGNLCTLWIGRMHLHANVERFERAPLQKPRPPQHPRPNFTNASSFVSAVKGNSVGSGPALVLDDSCVVKRDLEKFVMGEVKQFASIANLRVLLSNEGFQNVKLTYLGGLWVMVELDTLKAKNNFMKHVGVASWFNRLNNAQPDFVSKERIVWVDIEGVPLHAWSRPTFFKIGSKWGEVMDIEESKDDLFARKRVCIKTNQEDNILEKFKIIVQGKIFVIRAKELFVWSPVFYETTEEVYCSDDESDKGVAENVGNKVENSQHVNEDAESDVEAVSDTYFGDNDDTLGNDQVHSVNEKENSSDPFNIYDLLKKNKDDVGQSGMDTSITHPPGFTLVKDRHDNDDQEVGQAMGYAMNGSLKDMEKIIGLQGAGGGLVEVLLEGYSFTWSHPSASKMSKLDRFLVSDGSISLFPHISAICLDRHLSDHWPILLREVITDYGPTPFRLYHSWFSLQGFAQMEIRVWVAVQKQRQSGRLNDIKSKLIDIDSILDQGGVTKEILLSRMNLMNQIHDLNSNEARDHMQKAKVQWAIEGDENSKFFHGIINRKRAYLSVKGVMVDGVWVDDPTCVKEEFKSHFSKRFQDPGPTCSRLNFQFPSCLSSDQILELESPVSNEEIRRAVWACGDNKSPGPDGFTFEFFRKFWNIVGPDMCEAVGWFFNHNSFARGCNSSFVSLIPKIQDPKLVSDFRPISLIGSLYKVVTKILAMRLSVVISDLVSEVQTAFLPNRQILDGPFIINELLSWCKLKKQQAMVLKIDFAKAYDSIRWDFLDDVLSSFGFGSKWRSWIKGSLYSGMASILVNGSPTAEFQFHCGLKQGDPLAPYLFILVMEALHLSFTRAVEAGIFSGIKIDSSLIISHLFYADDAVFIGEWTNDNLRGIMQILHCFSLSSGLKINLSKSQLLGVGVDSATVYSAALNIGCSVMKTPFKYLGVMVGGNMAKLKAWDETILKLKSRLSKWKINTLSIGVASRYLNRNFFNGVQGDERKISWVKWSKVLASRKHGGLGVSSFFTLNRALLFKWVWRFISHDNSLWYRFISAMHGSNIQWGLVFILVFGMTSGMEILSFVLFFPRLFALENNKNCFVAEKLQGSITLSFRRSVRGGVESQQLEALQDLLGLVILSDSIDRWVWDLNGDGIFRVKDARNLLDEFFLPKEEVATRWIFPP
ncbi:RNA-directed DNA polymerase, eukaryota [Tanacetum coccineum]